MKVFVTRMPNILTMPTMPAAKAQVVGQFEYSHARFSIVWNDGSMTVGKGKRPSDPNQLAKWIVEQSTEESPRTAVPSDLSAYMAAMGRKGGKIGGKRRLVTMTKEQRRKVAVKAAKTRWSKKKADGK